MDGFEVLAAPSRRQILTQLRGSPRSVNELVEALAANQPAVSKHLKVLRQAGFVSCRGEGQQRIYQLEPAPFRELDAWLAPYRRLWNKRWELEATASGTRLTLRHTVVDKSWIPRVAAGWHICLDVADYLMAGDPIGRIVADEAKQHGWEQLNAAYSAQLGIANTGWPEEAGSAPRGA